jgi:hypothetical protein
MAMPMARIPMNDGLLCLNRLEPASHLPSGLHAWHAGSSPRYLRVSICPSPWVMTTSARTDSLRYRAFRNVNSRPIAKARRNPRPKGRSIAKRSQEVLCFQSCNFVATTSQLAPWRVSRLVHIWAVARCCSHLRTSLTILLLGTCCCFMGRLTSLASGDFANPNR